MSKSFFALLFLGMLLAAAGCRSTRPPAAPRPGLPAGFPNHSAAEIQRNILQGVDTLNSFRARANLTISSPQQSGSFSAKISHRSDDSLYMAISPGLGIEAMRMLVTPDSFYVYDRIKKRLTYGSRRSAAAALPAALTVEDLFGNLTGTLLPSPAVEWEVEADSSYYHLTNARRTYVVDPATWRVVRYEERNRSGQLVDQRLFSEFDRFGNLYLPRRLVFRRPPEETTAVLYYRDVTLNPEQLQFDLRVSSSAERRLVGG